MTSVVRRLDPEAECSICHTGDDTGMLDGGVHWTCQEWLKREHARKKAEAEARKAEAVRLRKRLERRRAFLDALAGFVVWLFHQSPAVVVGLVMALFLIVPQLMDWWLGVVMDAVGGVLGGVPSEQDISGWVEEGRQSVQP